MNTEAIVMMVIAMLVLWGGLGLALLNLHRTNPDSPDPAPDHLHRDL
ncbi:methionine/alanine import family NSS transporter small subunit [Nocardioides dongkuii]|nr:methionine/alanine import family NSS transporter small subunit [Nocardioides dongkuii]